MSRQRIGGKVSPAQRIPSGYEGFDVPDDFKIPSCGIEDADLALFNLFDKDLPFMVTRKGATEKVPVIFSGGERAMARRKNSPTRDKNGQFILPLISITRKNIDQSLEWNQGRAVGVSTGDFVVKKRLSGLDRQYQNIVNKLNLKNQKNVASNGNFADETNDINVDTEKVASRRDRSDFSLGNELLNNDLGNNVFEILTIPFPRFIKINYEITFWCQYMGEINQMLERLIQNYDIQGNSIRIDTQKGYWFVAYFQDDIADKSNLEEFSNEERILQHTLQVIVPIYIIGSTNDGDSVPIRRHISAPQISFGIYESNDDIIAKESLENPTGEINKFILSDIEPLDKQGNPQTGRDSKFYKAVVAKDPISGHNSTKFVKIKSVNTRVGERIIGAKNIADIDVLFKKS